MELTLKMNQNCVLLTDGDKTDIIVIERDTHLQNSVKDAVSNRYNYSDRIGKRIADECIGLYLGKKFPIVKKISDIIK